MNKEIKIERERGKYAIITTLIIVLFGAGGLINYLLKSEPSSLKENNKIEIKENQNSPNANKIETQNNYFIVPEKKDSLAKNINPIKSQSRNKPNTYSGDQYKKEESREQTTINANNALIVTNKQSGGNNTVNIQDTPIREIKPFPTSIPIKDTLPNKDSFLKKITIDANNALIVTNDQSGGTNTVVVNQVPLSQIKFLSIDSLNTVVKEIRTDDFPREKAILLPSAKHKYDSLYKTEFTISYYNKVNLNSIVFVFKSEDILELYISHSGSTQFSHGSYREKPKYRLLKITQPENGIYRFIVYSISKFYPKTDFVLEKM